MRSLSLRARLLLAASALFLVGLGLGWQTAVDGPDLSALKAVQDDWSAPGRHTTDTAALVKKLDQHSLWADAGPAADANGPSPEDIAAQEKAKKQWRLSGIVEEHGKAAWAVVLTPGVGKDPPHVQNSKVDDELPDGTKLVAIDKTSVTVADAKGQRQTIKMFLPN